MSACSSAHRRTCESVRQRVTTTCYVAGSSNGVETILIGMQIERRRKDRQLTASRGTFEVDRLSRLRQLTKLLQTWSHLGETKTIAQQLSPLKSIVQESGIPADFALLPARISGKGLETSDDTPNYYVQHVDQGTCRLPSSPLPRRHDSLIIVNAHGFTRSHYAPSRVAAQVQRR